jgi:hypothetical protein
MTVTHRPPRQAGRGPAAAVALVPAEARFDLPAVVRG